MSKSQQMVHLTVKSSKLKLNKLKLSKINTYYIFHFLRTKVVRVKSEYKNDLISLNLDTEFKALKPVITASAVIAYNGI